MALRLTASSLVTVLLVVAALRLGRDFLMPLALAALLGFWLSPVVSRLERWRVPRVGAVLLVITIVGGLFVGGGWLAGRQMASLPALLPIYRENLIEKVRTLRGPLGALERAGRVFDEIERELGAAPDRPPTVVVERQAPLSVASALVGPLLAPLGTAAAVAVLVLFLLLQREDLRDRLLAILGRKDLTATTDAIDDATARLSRYLGAQSMLCAAHGLLVGLGLFAIGIPAAWLWGLASGLLRFIPYLGPWVAAALPIGVSIAAFPGWSPALATICLFVALEAFSNNVLEPWLYGTSAGLSPFAVILSAFFWTWLWGIPGLFLATPLTVCAVVAGRYLESMAFLRTLLSQEPPLEPSTRLYQRLLSLDAPEARSILGAAIDGSSLSLASDNVVWPALRWLDHELERGAVEPEKVASMDEVLAEILASLEIREPDPSARPVRVCVGTGPADALARRWIAHLVAASGLPLDERPGSDELPVCCFASLSPRGMREAFRTRGPAATGAALCVDPRQEAIAKEEAARRAGVAVARSAVDLVRRLHSLTRRPRAEGPIQQTAARAAG